MYGDIKALGSRKCIKSNTSNTKTKVNSMGKRVGNWKKNIYRYKYPKDPLFLKRLEAFRIIHTSWKKFYKIKLLFINCPYSKFSLTKAYLQISLILKLFLPLDFLSSTLLTRGEEIY